MRLSFRGLADNKSALGTKVEIFFRQLVAEVEVAARPDIWAKARPRFSRALAAAPMWILCACCGPPACCRMSSRFPPIHSNAADENRSPGKLLPGIVRLGRKEISVRHRRDWSGVVGHWISPTSRNIPDPIEWIKVAGKQLKPQKRLPEPAFRRADGKVNFIDQLRLVAIDHPAGNGSVSERTLPRGASVSTGKLIVTQCCRGPCWGMGTITDRMWR